MRLIRTLMFFVFLFQTSPLLATEVTKVAYQVICDNPTESKKISEAIETRLQKAKLVVSEKLPLLKLIVYAQQDVNDRVNKNGWSFAVAHVTNAPTFLYASDLLKQKKQKTSELDPILLNMLRRDGFMTYLNVAHIDEMNKTNLDIITENFVNEFVARAH